MSSMGAEHFSYENGSLNVIDSTSHVVITGLLPEYVMMRVLGQQPPHVWQAIERHLALCAICRSEAEMLERLMNDVYSDSLPVYLAPPAPDLSFLRKPLPWPSATQPPELPVDLPPSPTPQPIIITFSPALLSQSQVRMLARAGDARLRYARTITPVAAQDPTITIEVLAPDDHPDLGIVRICVERPDRSPFDQAGSQIVLHIGEQCLLGATDPNGNIVFNDVPLDDIAGWQLTVDAQEIQQ
jgi:hypothetical protein